MGKWMLKDTKATDRDRSIIAGHYIFLNEFKEIKLAQKVLTKKILILIMNLKMPFKRNVII